MSGGVKTVFMENCSMEHGAALYLKSNLERGGYIEDVWVRNIKADNIGCYVDSETIIMVIEEVIFRLVSEISTSRTLP